MSCGLRINGERSFYCVDSYYAHYQYNVCCDVLLSRPRALLPLLRSVAVIILFASTATLVKSLTGLNERAYYTYATSLMKNLDGSYTEIL